MARRKITVEDALKVLEEAGIPLQVKPSLVETTVESKPKTISPAFDTSRPIHLPNVVKITLYAKHSVGSGGNMTGSGEEKQIEDAGVQSYGPGICIVSHALASHLLHADAAAKRADERMLDRTEHSYIIAQKRSPSGYIANVAVEVDSDLFNSSPLEWSRDFQHVIR